MFFFFFFILVNTPLPISRQQESHKKEILKEFCRTSSIIYKSTPHFIDVSCVWHPLFPEHNHNEVPGLKKANLKLLRNFKNTFGLSLTS